MNAGQMAFGKRPSLKRILSYYCMDVINVLLLLAANIGKNARVFFYNDDTELKSRIEFFKTVLLVLCIVFVRSSIQVFHCL